MRAAAVGTRIMMTASVYKTEGFLSRRFLRKKDALAGRLAIKLIKG
jgi:hypothetical protein